MLWFLQLSNIQAEATNDVNSDMTYTRHRTNSTRSQAVARIADRTASQQTLVPN